MYAPRKVLHLASICNEYEHERYEKSFTCSIMSINSGYKAFPDIAPGKTGSLLLQLPADWKKFDVLC
jgi:hypothetical protein